MLPGRTENAIKNYFYSTVRKNLRRVNKKLILKEKIQGPVKELMRDPKLSDLIFCNSRKSLKMAEKLNKVLKVEEGIDLEPTVSVIEDSTIITSNMAQENNIDSTLESQIWQQYLQQFMGMCFPYPGGLGFYS